MFRNPELPVMRIRRAKLSNPEDTSEIPEKSRMSQNQRNTKKLSPVFGISGYPEKQNLDSGNLKLGFSKFRSRFRYLEVFRIFRMNQSPKIPFSNLKVLLKGLLKFRPYQGIESFIKFMYPGKQRHSLRTSLIKHSYLH